MLQKKFCDLTADIVINPANSKLTNAAGAALDIAKRAGPEYQKFC